MIGMASILSLVIISGCSLPPPSTNETFLKYHNISKTNINFNIEAGFYSKAKIEEVMLKLPIYQERWNLKDTLQVKARYMGLIRQTAQCMNIEFDSQRIEIAKAELRYKVSDNCSEHEGAHQNVLMVLEEGRWKIESTELVL